MAKSQVTSTVNLRREKTYKFKYKLLMPALLCIRYIMGYSNGFSNNRAKYCDLRSSYVKKSIY